MKSFLFLLAGVTGALAYMIAKQKNAAVAALPEPVEELAHKLQDAWADHHTVA